MKFINWIRFLCPIVCLIVVLSGCQNSGKYVADGTGKENENQEAQDNATDSAAQNNESAISKEDTSGNSDNESEILAYIIDFDADNIGVDAIEWVTVPSSRAGELGINEEDGPSGFYIYNPDTSTEQFTLSTDCMITVLEWQNSYEPKIISADDFIAVLQERGEQNNFIPYFFKVTNGTITEISEHYVP